MYTKYYNKSSILGNIFCSSIINIMFQYKRDIINVLRYSMKYNIIIILNSIFPTLPTILKQIMKIDTFKI